MKKLLLVLLCLGLVGCATTSSVTPNLVIGMTKQEVIAKCGQPTQTGAMQDKNGRVLESLIYREVLPANALNFGAYPSPTITYVHFADGKVIYYGPIPMMPIEDNKK